MSNSRYVMIYSMIKQDLHEIEFKWKATSLKHFKLFLEVAEDLIVHFGPPQEVHIHDIYLDTADRFFGKARTSCRLRNSDGSWEFTIKASSPLLDCAR